MLIGPVDAGRTRLLAAEIFPMNVFSRYLIRVISLLGFDAAAGLLLALFTTFQLGLTNWMMSARAVIAGLRRCWWC